MKTNTDENETETETTFRVVVECREGGNWAEIDEETSYHDSLEDAEAEMAQQISTLSGEGNEFGPGEYRVTITDDDGNEIDSEDCIYDPTKDRLENADVLLTEVGEFSTLIIAADSEGFFRMEKNGGTQGAISRQEGDGRWSEMEKGIEELSLIEAIRALAEENGFSIAVDIVAKHGDCQGRKGVIREIADDLDDEEREEIADEIEDDE